MSLQLIAKQMEAKGRGGDSVLVHMTPGEVAGLQQLAQSAGGSLTVNPDTGLVEANFLKRMLPTLVGLGVGAFTMNPFAGAAAGAAVGGVQAKENKQDFLTGALMGGLGGYGGAGIGSSLASAGNAAVSQAATAANPSLVGPMPGAAGGAEALKAGVAGLGEEAGRGAFMQNVGGFGGLSKSIGMASAPTMMPGKMPGPPPVDDEMYEYDYDAGRTYAENTPSAGSEERLYLLNTFSDPRKIKTKGSKYAEGGITSLRARIDERLAKINAEREARNAERDAKRAAEKAARNAERDARNAARNADRNPQPATPVLDSALALAPTPTADLTPEFTPAPAPAPAPAGLPALVEAAPSAPVSTAPAAAIAAPAPAPAPAPAGLPALVEAAPSAPVSTAPATTAAPAPAPFTTPTVNLQGPTGTLTNAPGALPTFMSSPSAVAIPNTMSGASRSAFDYLMGKSSASVPSAAQRPAATSGGIAAPSSSDMYTFNPATGTFTKNPNYVDPDAKKDVGQAIVNLAESGGGNSVWGSGHDSGSGYVPSQDPTDPSFVGPQDPYSQGGGSAGESWENLPADMRGSETAAPAPTPSPPMAWDSPTYDSYTSDYNSGGGGDYGGYGGFGSDYGDTSMGGSSSFDSAYGWKAGGLMRLAKGGMASGGFVVPADVVSALGNGSTDAGLRSLNAMLGKAAPIKGKGDGLSDSIKTNIDGKQPARVADGEAYIDPKTVKRVGGAKKLYAMMDKIRAQAHGKTSQQRKVNPAKVMA